MKSRRLLLVPAIVLSTLIAGTQAYAQSGHQHGVLNPLLRLEMRSSRGAPLLPVIVTSTRDIAAQVRALGGTVNTDIDGRLATAHVPASRMEELRKAAGVVDVLPSQKMYPQLDRSVPEIGANQVWALRDVHGLPIQGNHVIVGMVDSGIDYKNPDFQNLDGSTRIKYLWDMLHSGTPPSGFTKGTECTAASINARQCPERDTEGHGTHVAGIAAGNGRSTNPPRMIGVAPAADLMVVASDLYTDQILAGWHYMVDRAHQLGEPIVINSSFGTQIGPHDGTEPDARAIDALSGPGVVFVTSAGNEAGQGVHTSGTLRSSQDATITVTSHGGSPDLLFAAFYPESDQVTATLKNVTTGETFGPVEFNKVLDSKTAADGVTSVTVDNTPWDSTHHSALVYLARSSTAGPVTGTWQLILHGTVVSGVGRYDAWLSQGTGGLQAFANPDESDTVGDPADASRGIAVGNYITRLDWTGEDGRSNSLCQIAFCPGGSADVGSLAYHSSRGPTADGRQKPDLAAPGTLIESSLSSDAEVCGVTSSDECLDPSQITPDGKEYVAMGTSMSAPHVTGTVALMLQANPTLDSSAVTEILRTSARHDQFTGSAAWSPGFGAGKLDALAAVKRVVANTSPTPTPATPTPTATPIPSPTPQPPPAVRITSAGMTAANGRAVVTPRVGQALSIWMTVRIDYATKGLKSVGEWKVTRSSGVVGYHLQTYSLTASPNKSYRWNWRFTPRSAGTHTYSLRATLAGRSSVRTQSFRVAPKKSS